MSEFLLSPINPMGPPLQMDVKFSRRPSIESIAVSTSGRARVDGAQQKNEDEDAGQGIIVVYDALESKSRDVRSQQSPHTTENTMIDIVAIPGLEAHPKKTWIKRRRIADTVGNDPKNFKDGPSCIADSTMLPESLPNSRIMTLSYASDWRAFGKDEQHRPVSQRVEAVADLLLRELNRLRKSCPKRPIIFLGHSLGGVIIEKAVIKSKVKSEYLEIYNSIAGTVFLGAPFKGSESQTRAALAVKAGSTLNITEYTPLFELMKQDSQHLADMLTDFLDVVNEANIQIFCFFELQKSDTSGLYRNNVPLGHLLPRREELVADEDSSTLQGKSKQGLNRNHYNMNKFETKRDREWVAVSSVIVKMASKASKSLKDRRNALPEKLSSEKYLEILTTLAALEADPDSDIQAIEDERGQAIEDSSRLMLQNAKIKAWFSAPQNGILWVSLYPGMGSGMMAVALQRQIEQEIRASHFDDYLCYFFCDSKNVKKNNTLSILKAFIRQIIRTTQRLALHLPFEQQRSHTKNQTSGNVPTWDSFANLKLAFLAMLKDPLVNSMTLIVDSIHKIDEDSRQDFLDLIDESLETSRLEGIAPKIRWICLGLERPDIKVKMQRALTVTADDLGSPAELVKSLKSLVRNRVVALAGKLNYSREYTFWLRTELLNRAEGNTTWVDLACGEIESVAPRSIDVRSFAEHLKQDLVPLYRQIQARVLKPDTEGLEYTKEILRTMLILVHSPSVQELAVLSGLPSEIWTDLDEVRKYINRCGSFLKIVSGKKRDRVRFMDTTASEYLNAEAADALGHHDRLSIQHGIIALRSLNFMMNASDESHPASDIKITYPKRFWLEHAQKASEELPDLVEDFGLDTNFWSVGGMSWWPRLKQLTSLWPKLNNLSVIHLAAYFNFSVLLNQLLEADSVHKTQINANDSLGRTPLYWAAYQGHMNIVQTLVEHGADINAPSTNVEEGLSPLYGAAEKGHLDIVKWLLEHKAILDVPNKNYGTALCGAASGGQTAVVEVLLKSGAAKIVPQGWIRGNALTAACLYGHPETAKVLIKEDFDVNVPSSTGVFALESSVQSEDIELVKMLLGQGSNLGSRQAALDAAALNGFEQAIKLILEKPAGLKLRQCLLDVARLGYTMALDHFPRSLLTQQDLDAALYVATDMEKKETVEKLLIMGASANAEGEGYGNALQASAWDGTTDILKLLVAKGANVNTIGGQYGTALQAAAFQGDKENIDFLIKSGAKVNERRVGEYGNALYAAAAGNNLEAVQTLVEHGANVNAVGGSLNYALLQAAKSTNFEMIKYLLEHGANIHCKSDNGTDVMLQASYTLPKEDLQYLHQRGANVHTRDENGNTVLIGCARYQDVPSVQWLTEDIGVDVNAVSSEYGSALQAAASASNEEICEILLKHGADANQVDDNIPPALLKAAALDDKETFDILLKYGADITYYSYTWGNLLEAAIEGENVEILKIVLEKGHFDLAAVLRDKGTPLHMACLGQYGSLSIDHLLEKGANPNAAGGKYNTPLQAAAFKGYSSYVTTMLEHGADKSIRGGFYDTASNAAAAQGWATLPRQLLGDEGGPATNEALHYAIHYHEYGVVNTLIQNLNADVTSIGKWGNVFQALSTSLSVDEINSDNGLDDNNQDDADDDSDTDDASEEEDSDDDDDEIEVVVEPEPTDEQKVQMIDSALKEALTSKGIDHNHMPRQMLREDAKEDKSFLKMMKKAFKGDDNQRSLYNGSTPQSTGSQNVVQARAISTYRAQASDELSLTANETVTVVDSTSNKDWWKVRKTDGTTAFVPANLMKALPSDNHTRNGVKPQEESLVTQILSSILKEDKPSQSSEQNTRSQPDDRSVSIPMQGTTYQQDDMSPVQQGKNYNTTADSYATNEVFDNNQTRSYHGDSDVQSTTRSLQPEDQNGSIQNQNNTQQEQRDSEEDEEDEEIEAQPEHDESEQEEEQQQETTMDSDAESDAEQQQAEPDADSDEQEPEVEQEADSDEDDQNYQYQPEAQEQEQEQEQEQLNDADSNSDEEDAQETSYPQQTYTAPQTQPQYQQQYQQQYQYQQTYAQPQQQNTSGSGSYATESPAEMLKREALAKTKSWFKKKW